MSIGHLSTVALAASTLGTMTASVTGYSIIQGSLAPLILCCPVPGRRQSLSSSDFGLSAWVTELPTSTFVLVDFVFCPSIFHVRRCDGRFSDSTSYHRLHSCSMMDPASSQPISFLWFNAESILLFLHQQPDVAHLAAVYLKYSSIGLPAYAFNCVSR